MELMWTKGMDTTITLSHQLHFVSGVNLGNMLHAAISVRFWSSCIGGLRYRSIVVGCCFPTLHVFVPPAECSSAV